MNPLYSDRQLFLEFLSCALLSPEILLETRVTSKMIETTWGGASSKLWGVLEAQTRSKIKPDTMTLLQAIKNMGEPEHSLYAEVMKSMVLDAGQLYPNWVNWQFYEQKIIDAWKQDRIHEACSIVVEMGDNHDPAHKSDCLEKVLAEINLIETGYKIENMRDYVLDTVKIIEERHKNKSGIVGISTGFPELDRSTFGLLPGMLWIIGARPSQGKSAIGLQIARNIVSRGADKVGVISIESSNRELAMRNMSSESHLSQSKINTGNLGPSDFHDIQNAAEKIYNYGDRMLLFDKPSLEFSELSSVAKRMVRDGVKIIFVDYIQLIKFKGLRTKFETVSEVSIGLKSLARELNIPIVALAQLGRNADDGKPHMGDFQHSSQIEQDADVALLLWHYEAGMIKEYGKDVPKVESYIIVAKARDGITGDIRVAFEKPILTFREVSQNNA